MTRRDSIAKYLLEWLIDHKIQCDKIGCLCSASTPEDALCDLFDDTGDLEIAECLDLSVGRINETLKTLGKELVKPDDGRFTQK